MKVTALLFLLLSAGFVHAQDGDPPWRAVVASADADNDGEVSMDEVKEFPHNREFLGFQAFMADHFIAFDQDGDGNLSADELRAGIAHIGMNDEQVNNGFRHGFSFMSVQ
jgi:Ca2+-binding EF-hand superfamily protein